MQDTTDVMNSIQVSKPADVGWDVAANFCKAKHAEQISETTSTKSWVAFPWVLAIAWEAVSKGWPVTKYDTGNILVPSTSGTRSCTWGIFNIAGLGRLALTARINEKLHRPECRVELTHRVLDSAKAKTLLDQIDAEMQKSAFMRGLALELPVDGNGKIDLFAEPSIVHVPDMSSEDVVLAAHIKAELECGVLFPIQNPTACKAAGISPRRGALFAGRPGTGKTLSARLAAHLAIKSGWGVFYIGDSRALEQALTMAQAMSPVLVICEDIDRQLSGERTAATDRILNALDGLDRSKPVQLICTSNAPEKLPAPLLRAGRLDTILIFEAPDKDAARTLLLRYLNGYASTSIRETGCEGLLPASIKEVADRAILHALRNGDSVVTEAAVLACAKSVRAQQAFLERAENPEKPVPEPQRIKLSFEQSEEKSDLVEIAESIREVSRLANGHSKVDPLGLPG